MIPAYPEFKPIELEDKKEVDEYMANYPPETCELTFANIYIWRHWEKPLLTRIHGNLCIFCSPPDETAYFLEPVGENQLEETVQVCLSYGARLSRVFEKFIHKIHGPYQIKEDRDNFDYVYLTEELAQLKGKKFDGKRNLIKKLEKNYQTEIKPLSDSDLSSCFEVAERWAQNSPEENRLVDARTRAASTAIKEALNNFKQLELQGIVARIEGRVEGFCLGEKLNNDTVVVHVELADRNITGLYQYMNRECARTIWHGYTYINREQDAGIPGLRRSKLSYYPHHLVKKYDLTRL
ncbi:MAG: DUF2156 domain-containing protein [Candidatus Saccharicenans sp.]|uniref:DUF2156 domain-containing protein n=1 Tax=Candidatus Saccharicenans sp. TaxID=2819258 RepID=UPI00404965EE